MQGAKDLLQSERGVFCTLALLITSGLVIVGKLDTSSWLDFVKWLTGVLVASKTVTTAVETYSTNKPQTQVTEVKVAEARVVREGENP